MFYVGLDIHSAAPRWTRTCLRTVSTPKPVPASPLAYRASVGSTEAGFPRGDLGSGFTIETGSDFPIGPNGLYLVNYLWHIKDWERPMIHQVRR
jgi:hypothetical protein